MSRRNTPEGGSDDPFLVRVRRRVIAFAFLFWVLILRKVAWLSGLPIELLLGATVALIAAALVVYFVRRQRRAQAPEPQDTELQLSPTDVEEQLRSGALSPHDLVLDGKVWQTLLESPQFSEPAAERNATLERRALAGRFVLVAFGVLAAIGVLAVLVNFWAVFSWLALDR